MDTETYSIEQLNDGQWAVIEDSRGTRKQLDRFPNKDAAQAEADRRTRDATESLQALNRFKFSSGRRGRDD
jgi:hypothetical protein